VKIKKKIRILITCLGGRRALDLINVLKKNKIYDYEIFGTDIKKNLKIKNKINKFYQVPKGQTKEFIKRIIEIIKKNQIKLAIFGADEEVLNISKNRYLFKNLDCFIPIMEKKKLNIISNKLNLFKNLEKKKISLAKWNIIKNLSDLKKFSLKFKNNFVLKNADSRGGRDIFIIDKKIKQPKKMSTGSQEIHLNYDDLLKKFNIKNKLRKNTYIAMEKLNRPAYDVDALSLNGKIKKLIIRKRLFRDPYKKHSFSTNKKIKNYCEQIIKSLKLSYLFDIDIMMDKKKEPKILEINPRMSGTIYLTLKKVNLINYLYSLNRNDF